METGQFRLTAGQKRAFDTIMSEADTFVTGGSGTGKSVVAMEAIRELEAQGKNVVVCAPTGTAAVSIGGTTIHKAFGFSKGPCITEKTHKLTVRTPRLIRMADVIVIDEVSMCRMDMMDAICASVLKVREETGHFIQMVVVGDFCQLPPPIVEGSGERELLQEYYGKDVGHAFAFQAPNWKKINLTNVELLEVIRQQDDDFVHNLNLLRLEDTSSIRYFNTYASFEDDPDSTKIYARNEDVDRINKKELTKIPGKLITFHPYYSGLPADMIYADLSVSIKVGAKVIITTNQATPFNNEMRGNNRGLHNGSTGVVIDAKSYSDNPEDDFVAVSSGGRSYIIRRRTDNIYSHRVDSKGKIRREIIGSVSYMPVKPGYVMTIHRSQGQTFDSIVLDPTCWDSGQLYVAISRLRSIDGLHLTRRITPGDVHLAPIVREFYDHLHDYDYIPSWEMSKVDTISPKKVPDSKNDNIIMLPGLPVVSKTEVSRLTGNPRSAADEKDSVNIAPTEDTTEVHDSAEKPIAKTTVVITDDGDDAADNAHVKKPASKKKNVDDGQSDVEKTRGRPVRYTNDSKVCRIPVELVDEVKMMLRIVCPKGGVDTKELERFKSALRKLCEADL